MKFYFLFLYFNCIFASDLDDYLAQRKEISLAEQQNHIGHDLMLSEREWKVNEILMRHKLQELDNSMFTGEFAPSKSFYLSKTDIESSEVFQFIRKMPKGAALHTHHISLGKI